MVSYAIQAELMGRVRRSNTLSNNLIKDINTLL